MAQDLKKEEETRKKKKNKQSHYPSEPNLRAQAKNLKTY